MNVDRVHVSINNHLYFVRRRCASATKIMRRCRGFCANLWDDAGVVRDVCRPTQRAIAKRDLFEIHCNRLINATSKMTPLHQIVFTKFEVTTDDARRRSHNSQSEVMSRNVGRHRTTNYQLSRYELCLIDSFAVFAVSYVLPFVHQESEVSDGWVFFQ